MTQIAVLPQFDTAVHDGHHQYSPSIFAFPPRSYRGSEFTSSWRDITYQPGIFNDSAHQSSSLDGRNPRKAVFAEAGVFSSCHKNFVSEIINRSFLWWLHTVLIQRSLKLLRSHYLFALDEGLLSENLGKDLQKKKSGSAEVLVRRWTEKAALSIPAFSVQLGVGQ